MTPSEFKKLEAAVMCMKGISLVETEVNLEGFHIHQQSIIYLLSSFVEEEKEKERLTNIGFEKVVEPFNLKDLQHDDMKGRIW